MAKLGILGEETSLKSGESVEGSSSYDYEYFMTDTLTWTARMAAESGQWNSVTYGKGLFVALADFGDESVIYICLVKESLNE